MSLAPGMKLGPYEALAPLDAGGTEGVRTTEDTPRPARSWLPSVRGPSRDGRYPASDSPARNASP